MPRTSARVTYANVTSTLALVVALGAGGAYAANTVKSKDIVDGQVKAADMHKNSVGTSALKDRGVSAADLGAGAVGPISVQDNAIRTEHLASASVGSVTVIDGSLKEVDFATGTIGTFALGDGQVTGTDLGSNSVSTGKIQDGQVTQTDLGTNAVNSAKVADNTLTLADLVGADATAGLTVTNLAGSRCGQVNVNAPGAATGQVGFVSSTTAVTVGWGITVLKVNDGTVTLNLCNLTGATATLTNQSVRVVTFG